MTRREFIHSAICRTLPSEGPRRLAGRGLKCAFWALCAYVLFRFIFQQPSVGAALLFLFAAGFVALAIWGASTGYQHFRQRAEAGQSIIPLLVFKRLEAIIGALWILSLGGWLYYSWQFEPDPSTAVIVFAMMLTTAMQIRRKR